MRTQSKSYELAFLTDFTERCAQTVPAVTQLARELGARLTLLHACDARCAHPRDALERFAPEVDLLHGARRLSYEGDAVDAVRELASRRTLDMLFAPGLRRGPAIRLRTTPRAALVASCPAPVWTLGARARPDALRWPPRRIACWLDPRSRHTDYLRRAARLAEELGGELHVLHVAPDFQEGELGVAAGPVCADEVAEVLRDTLGRTLAPVIHVAPGGSSAGLLSLIRACAPDLLALSPRDSLRWGLFGARLHSLADRVDCPVLCFGPESHTGRSALGHHDGHRATRLVGEGGCW